MTREEYSKALGIIQHNVPDYQYGKPILSMRKIKELLAKMEYDQSLIDNLDQSFCEGFGIAREIILQLLSDDYADTCRKEQHADLNPDKP